MDDQRLLSDYIASHSEDAFSELVRRHLGLVYSTALRRLDRVADAEDVTQAVFTLLAQKARRLSPKIILASWLYQTTCFKAAQFRRAESRRLDRETKSAAMHDAPLSSDREPDWQSIAPVLDDAMQKLPDRDRVAILLRFFQGKRLRDVALELGVEEDAARKRVDRALAKLRDRLAKHGAVCPPALLATSLVAHAATATPALAVSSVSAAALQAAALAPATTASLSVAKLLSKLTFMKLKPALVTAALLATGGALAVYWREPGPRTSKATGITASAVLAPPSASTPVARLFEEIRPDRPDRPEAGPDAVLSEALARLKEALHGPADPRNSAQNRARDILFEIPVEKRVAALRMVTTALRDANKHVCLRAISLVPLIWPEGEAALPILFDLARTKSAEWPEVASAALTAAAQARPHPDIVPELVAAAMRGPAAARRAFAQQAPLLKSFIPGSETAFALHLQPYLYAFDPEWRFTAAQALAQLPGAKPPAVVSELARALSGDGAEKSAHQTRAALGALLMMGQDARAAIPALTAFRERHPAWTDSINTTLKAITPEDFKGVGVGTPLPPLDPEAARLADGLESGAIGLPELTAALNNPQTALAAARALAEFGDGARDALPELRRAFEAALQTNVSAALVLGAAIERLAPESPKPLLLSLDVIPALDAVFAEARQANRPEWNEALQTLPKRLPLGLVFTHRDVQALATELQRIDPALHQAFVAKLLEADAKFATIVKPPQ